MRWRPGTPTEQSRVGVGQVARHDLSDFFGDVDGSVPPKLNGPDVPVSAYPPSTAAPARRHYNRDPGAGLLLAPTDQQSRVAPTKMSQLTSTARHQSVSLTARVAFCSSSPG